MATLRDDLGKRLKQIPCELKDEFPQVPLDTIEHDVDVETRQLTESAQFTDFLPVLVHKAVRERLRRAA